MPEPLNITNLPGARQPVTNNDGTMDRVWYRFFFNLFNLTGAGSSPTSIPDLLVLPDITTAQDPSGTVALYEVGTLPSPTDLGPVYSAIAALNEQPQPPDLGPLLAALDGLSLSPSIPTSGVYSVIASTGLTGGGAATSVTLSFDLAAALHWTGAQTFDKAITTPTTVALLPATPVDGQRAFVTDATAPAFGVAVVGLGAVHVPVYYDGNAAAWTVG